MFKIILVFIFASFSLTGLANCFQDKSFHNSFEDANSDEFLKYLEGYNLRYSVCVKEWVDMSDFSFIENQVLMANRLSSLITSDFNRSKDVFIDFYSSHDGESVISLAEGVLKLINTFEENAIILLNSLDSKGVPVIFIFNLDSAVAQIWLRNECVQLNDISKNISTSENLRIVINQILDKRCS